MREITQDNYVIVTRNLGKFYVSQARADGLIKLLNSDNCPKMLKINTTHVAASDVVGVDTAARMYDVERERTGQWKCAQNNWHDKFDKCKCNWGMDTSSTTTKKTEHVENEDPEQVERLKLLSKIRQSGYSLKRMVQLKSKSNADLKEIVSKL